MSKLTHRIEIPEGEPPTEFLLLKFGETITTEGNYLLDLESAKEIITTWKRREIQLFFDYNHLSLAPKTPDDGISAGWYDLALREDGIWVCNIRWTEKAFNHIKAREYALFSPVLKLNRNRYAIRLINCALTNLPATERISPIIPLSEALDIDLRDLVENSDELLDRYREMKRRPDEKSLSILKETIKEMEKLTMSEAIKEVVDEVTDAMINEIVDDKLQGPEMKEHLQKLDETMDHMYMLGQHMSKRMMEHDEPMKSLYGKAHSYCMKMAEMFAEKRKEIDPHGMYEARSVMSESVVLSEIEKLVGDKGEAVIGKIVGYKTSLDLVKKLSEEVDSKDKEVLALKEKVSAFEKTKMVETAIVKDKKLLPKQREWAMSLSEAQLKSYLDVAEVLSLSEKVLDVAPAQEAVSITLTESDKMMIAQFGINEEKYKQEKAKRFK